MSDSFRMLAVVGLTIALVPLAPGTMLHAEDSDEVGSFAQATVSQRDTPAAAGPGAAPPPKRWFPRLRRAIGLDDRPLETPPLPAAQAQAPADAQPPAGESAPAATSSVPAAAAMAPQPTEAEGASTAAEPPPSDEIALPPLTILPQPSADNKPAPGGYNRSIADAIAYYNRYGRGSGHVRLYARESEWGPAVKLQDCFGDNIRTKFAVAERGQAQRLWFQYKDVSHGRRRQRWVMVDPGMVIRGRVIWLRAQSSAGSDIVTLDVVGNCMTP